jgi:thioredoxin reductase (NADPH)
VGGGDAACDEAQYLSRLSSQIVLIHRRDRFRAQKALAERVLKNPNIQVRFNTRMLEIRGDKQVGAVVLEEGPKEGGAAPRRYEEDAAAVFIFTGTVPQASFLDGLGLAKDESGYLITGQDMRRSAPLSDRKDILGANAPGIMATAIPGLFVAGDVRATPFRQVVVAAGEGAVAAHAAAAYIDEYRGEAYR